MKQDDIRINGSYRLEGGQRVRVLKKGVKGVMSSRRDHVLVKYVSGPRATEEVKVASRKILRAWTIKDDEEAGKRAVLTKKVGAARVKLAMLGFDGEGMRVQRRGDNTIGLQFYGDAAERLLEIIERASEEAAA